MPQCYSVNLFIDYAGLVVPQCCSVHLLSSRLCWELLYLSVAVCIYLQGVLGLAIPPDFKV